MKFHMRTERLRLFEGPPTRRLVRGRSVWDPRSLRTAPYCVVPERACAMVEPGTANSMLVMENSVKGHTSDDLLDAENPFASTVRTSQADVKAREAAQRIRNASAV